MAFPRQVDAALQKLNDALQELDPAFKGLGYLGGQSRSGIASALEAITGKDNLITPEEYQAAAKFQGHFPSSATIMERAGWTEPPSAEVPLDMFLPPVVRSIGKVITGGEDLLPRKTINARDAVGFGLDVATDPLTYAGGILGRALGKTASVAAEAPKVESTIRVVSPPLRNGTPHLPWFEGSRTEDLMGGLYPLEFGSREELAKHLAKAGLDYRNVQGEFAGAHLLDEGAGRNAWESLRRRFAREGLREEEMPSYGVVNAKHLPFSGAYNKATNRILVNEAGVPLSQRPSELVAGTFAHEGQHAVDLLTGNQAMSSPELLFDPEKGGLSNRSMLTANPATVLRADDYLAELSSSGVDKWSQWANRKLQQIEEIRRISGEEAANRALLATVRVARGKLAPNPAMIDFIQSRGHFADPIVSELDIPMLQMTREAVSNGLPAGVWQRLYGVEPNPLYQYGRSYSINIPTDLPVPPVPKEAGFTAAQATPWASMALHSIPQSDSGEIYPAWEPETAPASVPSPIPSPSPATQEVGGVADLKKTVKHSGKKKPKADPYEERINQRLREREDVRREMRGR